MMIDLEQIIKDHKDLAPRRFMLYRTEDISGISGIGVVGFGACFINGPCILYWSGDHSSLNEYKSVEDLLYIHSHGSRTQVIWID